ncbi:MAG: hypothetical protein GYB31_00365 [Bacteroidetes bacterium]|nr:hypothetical protein [Bacteroidota bacterium]
MPSTIPYDPSIVIGNLVHPEDLKRLQQIGDNLADADQKEAELNNLIALKRSIDMTVQELVDMSIDPKDLIKQSQDVGKDITKAAVEYAKAKVKGEKANAKIKGKSLVQNSVESPIDYNRTDIKYMPLAADSMKLNAQYFSFDENMQDSKTQASSVKAFVSESVSWLGDNVSSQASASVQTQMNSQYSRHSISGTLVISISCTHKNALLLAPFILDVDKAIRVWNQVYPSSSIKPDDVSALMKISKEDNTSKDAKEHLTLISGATFGSCFIGMVHVLNTTTTQSSEKMKSIAASLQSQFSVAGWFSKVSGGFGVDSSFSNDAKSLLSAQNIQSHCTLTTVGAIPSIRANDVAMAVKQFATFDGAESMDKLSQLQNATAGDKDSVDKAATDARTGAQMMAMENTKIKGVLEGLAPLQEKANKILDINSMMVGMEDYIDKAMADNFQGVPINYYTKPITKGQLAQMWVAKYFPGKYLSISGDDSKPGESEGQPATG